MFNYSFYKTRIHIVWSLLFSLTFPKILNIIRNLFAFYFKLQKAGKVPSIVTLHLSYNCNYSCVMCQKNSLDENVYSKNLMNMDFSRLETLLRKNAKYIAVLKITGGEPFLYPDFEKLIDLLNELKLKYTLLTNGSLLYEKISRKLLKNCLEISLSIDSANDNIYAYMRKGGSLDVIKENILQLNRLKKSRKVPHLNVATTCFTFNIDGLSELVEFCYQYKIPTISVCEGGYYNTAEIKEEHFIKNNPEQCLQAVNKAQKVADKNGITIRWNSPVLYFAKEENQVISNHNRIVGCVNFFFSAQISPDFKMKICALSNEVADMNEKDIQEVWNGKEMLGYRKEIVNNCFPSTCRYCPDYNEHFDEQGKEYSFIDYQKRTKYWKV